MWNPFQKNIASNDDAPKEKKDKKNASPEEPKMGFMQKMAMKKFEKMSPEEREKLMKKVMSPENVHKHKGKILKEMNKMLASGQINKQQYAEAKRKMGLF